MDLVIEIYFSYYVPLNKSRWFLLACTNLGFFKILLIISYGMWSEVIIVTTLLSIHLWIWKFLSSFIQRRVLNLLSDVFLISFGGHSIILLAVLTNVTPSYLAPISIRRKVKNYPYPPHTYLYFYCWVIQWEWAYYKQLSSLFHLDFQLL